MSMKKSRVKEKHIRINEIQAAARELFFSKGLKGTTMESIAKKARLSKGTVYFYFKSKEDLYISMMMPVLEELGRQLLKFEKDVNELKYETCQEVIIGLKDVFLLAYQYDTDGLRIVNSFQQGEHFLEVSEATSEKISHRARVNFNVMRRTFSRAIELGMFKDLNVIKLSDALWALFVGIIQLEESKFRSTGKNHLYETLKYSFRMISDGICKS
ncbi:MAG: TetR/AcrR family transcriptional regulator [Deltaproteobacteria bacterium]|nr:TetR/AcrR family transcriptional regulator [Deltaproteobacteria bacterium]